MAKDTIIRDRNLTKANIDTSMMLVEELLMS